MSNELSIIATKNFNGVEFNCYKADGNNNDGDFWATREQIGQLLEYVNPLHAIKDIHTRHADRLDKFSTWRNLSQVEGSRTVTREVIVYNFKGLLEICRFSNQPKANAVMDFLWDIAEEIRQHGFYATPAKVEEILQDPDNWIKVLEALKAEREKALSLAVKNVQLEEKIEEDKSKVIFAEAVEASENSVLIGELAKILRQNGVNVGEIRLFKWMRDNGYLSRARGEDWNLPTQRSMDAGLFKIKKTAVNDPNRGAVIRRTPKVTGKGQIYFVNGFRSGRFVI